MDNKELVFYSILDFYPRKETIKCEYNAMSLNDKLVYKMYVYSLPFMEDNIKDLIWEYLNGWEEGVFELSKHYRKHKEKNERRKKLEKEEDEWEQWLE